MAFHLHSMLRILSSAAILWLTSCLNPHGVRMQEVDPLRWSVDDPAAVAYENADTVSRREIRTVVRLQRDFAYETLNLQITTIAPNGLRWKDTVSMPTLGHLPDRSRYGEIEQTYRRQVTLNQSGRYLFTFAPVMPDRQTEGVTAVGIHIVPE